MQTHQISAPKGANKKRKIVGRGKGSGLGKTSGRGHGGQRSREGRNIGAASEGGQSRLVRRLPKVGFTPHRPNVFQVINVADLNKLPKDFIVTVKSLKKKKMIGSINKPVKILAVGELKKILTIQVENISKAAQEKIKTAGGKIEAPVKLEGQEKKNEK